MRTRALCLGVLIAASAACGGGSGGGGDAASPSSPEAAKAGGGSDVCRFVTTEEASALLGGDVGEPRSVSTPGVGDINAAAACTYTTSAGGSVQIVASTVDDPAEFLPDENGVGAGAEKVSGVGDDAFVIAGAFSAVSFRVGSDTVLIAVSVPGDAGLTRDELVALGKTAAGRN
jgi:hypothetical protein